MSAIDSILSIAVQQGATELRLGTDREPSMFRHGARMKLSLEETSDDTLRLLLGPMFDEERERMVGSGQPVEFPYHSSAGQFEVVITGREGEPGIDAVFHRGTRPRGVTVPAAPSQPSVQLRSPGPLETATPPQPTAQPVHLSAPGIPGERLTELLRHAMSLRASDLHLTEGDTPALRIDGRLQSILADAVPDLDTLLGGVLPGGFQSVARSGRSTDLAFGIPGAGRFRLNAYVAGGRPCASIRLLPDTPPPLQSLQMPVPLDDLTELPHGLVIVCGPTGSGKSTTLASLAQEVLRRRSVMLISLEDPVEYVLRAGPRGALVRQREIGRDVRDFPTGLRDALREDPDVLLIGEMRDAESIALTLTAAETGHLVLASLHSRSAASAIDRMVDSTPEGKQQQIRIQLADSLRAVISQRLLPRADDDGRMVAMEVLRVNHAVASLIREGRTAQIATAMQSGRKEGQIPLERCLGDLVRAGQVNVEDARAVANDPVALAGYLRG